MTTPTKTVHRARRWSRRVVERDGLRRRRSHEWASMNLPELATLTGGDATSLTFVGPSRTEGGVAVHDVWRVAKSGGAATLVGTRPADALEASDGACVYTVTGSVIGAQELQVTRRR
jgi:hypothetical protein